MFIDEFNRAPRALRSRKVSLLGAALLLVGASSGCSEAERQTLDRFEDYQPSVFTSPADCEDVLSAASASARRSPRIGSWNVRYFPDTEEAGVEDPRDGTDVTWLSCAISSLEVDVLAVQEFKRTPRAREAQAELIERLNQRTSGDWRIELASCDPENVQHPGFLYDASRVKGSHFREIPALNPSPECSNDSSPGFAGYFELEGGPDFHMISIHFQSGDGPLSRDGRQQALSAMPAVVSEATALVADDDVVFTGDFNTSGCTDCDSPIESETEVQEMRASFEQRDNPLRALDADRACSREDGGNSHLLDHFVIADAMKEVPSDATTQVGGFCAEGACDRLRQWQVEARHHLSDHCPILLDLRAEDDD